MRLAWIEKQAELYYKFFFFPEFVNFSFWLNLLEFQIVFKALNLNWDIDRKFKKTSEKNNA